MIYTKVLEMILPVIAMILIGAIAGKKQIFEQKDIAAIKKFAVNISLTAVVLNAFSTAEYTLKTLIIPIIIFSVCFVLWGVGKLIVKAKPEIGIYLPYVLTGFEAGMLGYTLYAILYGTSNLSAFATVDLGQVLFVFTFYKISLSRDTAKENINIKKEIFTSPIILGILVGIVIGTSGLYTQLQNWQVAGIFDGVLNFIAAPTSALILFSIGYDLVIGKIEWNKAFKFAFLRLIILAVFGGLTIFIIHTLFGVDQSLDRAIILMFLLPPPFVLPIFADDKTEQSTLASVLSISTTFTLVAFIVLASLSV